MKYIIVPLLLVIILLSVIVFDRQEKFDINLPHDKNRYDIMNCNKFGCVLNNYKKCTEQGVAECLRDTDDQIKNIKYQYAVFNDAYDYYEPVINNIV